MIEVHIPGRGRVELIDLVLDFNGTMALDGRVLDGVRLRLVALSKVLRIHVITADTFGTVREAVRKLPCELVVLEESGQDEAKADLVRGLGPESTVAIGNGRNDVLMLQEAALGIAVIEGEGGAVSALQAADIVSTSIDSALDLLRRPDRLVATLRT